jgi:hypothetical protein
VDRRERNVVVTVDDDGNSIVVPSGQLPKDCVAEGAVLRVSRDGAGAWNWAAAKRDHEEEARRRERGATRIRRLSERDPGGDVSL